MALIDFDKLAKEYSGMEDDFGFSAVSEEEYNSVINKTAETADDYKSRLKEVEKMIIPFNMEDGLLICAGKSNPKWNFSAPHGAGRIGSRKWAKANLSADEARTRMEQKGIYTSCVPTDEVKGAYKDPAVIEAAIEPTAVIVGRIKPILNCKEEDKKGTKKGTKR
jgi:RNA-splicing ligase RtcB